MFTATIKNKEEVNGLPVITVTFTDGTKTFDEKIEPQTKDAFHSWVEGRLHTLNEQEEMKTGPLTIDRPAKPEESEEDKAFRVWLRKMNRLQIIKTNLIDTGVFTGSEKPIEDLRADLKATFKPAYIAKL